MEKKTKMRIHRGGGGGRERRGGRKSRISLEVKIKSLFFSFYCNWEENEKKRKNSDFALPEQKKEFIKGVNDSEKKIF